MIFLISTILAPVLVFLTCKGRVKSKPSATIQTRLQTKTHNNLHHPRASLALQEDNSKQRKVKEGSMVKEKQEDLEKLPKFDSKNNKINNSEQIISLEHKKSKSNSASKINQKDPLQSLNLKQQTQIIESGRKSKKPKKRKITEEDVNEIGQNDKKSTEPIPITEPNQQVRYEIKASLIRQGMRANPRDPQYDTFKGQIGMPELEHDCNIITYVNR